MCVCVCAVCVYVCVCVCAVCGEASEGFPLPSPLLLADHSSFTAPELFAGDRSASSSEDTVEKVHTQSDSGSLHTCVCLTSTQSYVYSLGMTVYHAMQNGLEDGQVLYLPPPLLFRHPLLIHPPPPWPLYIDRTGQ